MNLIEIAKEVALQAYNEQFDKPADDFILHHEAVADLVESDDVKVVAWLHDTLASHLINESELRKTFPDYIVEALIALTHRDGERGSEYLRQLTRNPLAVEVKVADLAHNTELRELRNHRKWELEQSRDYQVRITNLLNLFK